MPKTAHERLEANKKEKKVILEKDFAGVKKGQRLYVATPRIIDDYINKIPYGKTSSIPILRNELAQQNECDATCPVSTAIFIRIAAQAAIDDLASGKKEQDITPFWRLLSSEDNIAKKLSIDGQWIDMQREIESSKT